jgi:hypothetical protein
MLEPTWRRPTVTVRFRAETCGDQCMACTKALELPSTSTIGRLISACYGMNEIGDGLLAGQCDYTKALIEITFVRRVDCGTPTHIYKKPDFSNRDSMGNRILIALCNQLYLTISCVPGNRVLTRRLMASRFCEGL